MLSKLSNEISKLGLGIKSLKFDTVFIHRRQNSEKFQIGING